VGVVGGGGLWPNLSVAPFLELLTGNMNIYKQTLF